MKEIKLKIEKKLEDKEIKFILKNVLLLSNRVITKLKMFPDGITLNGNKAFVTVRVKENDLLVLRMYDEPSKNIEPSDLPLDIIFENEDILIVNKPRNMPTHPSLNHYTDTLANAVMNHYRNKDFTFRVITRLDRNTSGLVLIAKNKIAAQQLSFQMENKQIKKEYYAICHGCPEEKQGFINAPIKRASYSGITRVIHPEGKESLTEYSVIKSDGILSLLKLIPHTGRTHQLRVHLAYIGTPIYGDELYGSTAQECNATLLHCRKLSFFNPVNNEEMTLCAPLPEDMIL